MAAKILEETAVGREVGGADDRGPIMRPKANPLLLQETVHLDGQVPDARERLRPGRVDEETHSEGAQHHGNRKPEDDEQTWQIGRDSPRKPARQPPCAMAKGPASDFAKHREERSEHANPSEA